MIDLISEEQVQEIIKQKKRKFPFGSAFVVLTDENHILSFFQDKNVGISTTLPGYLSYQPEIAKLYDLKYTNSNTQFLNDKYRNEMLYYELIENLGCFFSFDGDELEQELRNRGVE